MKVVTKKSFKSLKIAKLINRVGADVACVGPEE